MKTDQENCETRGDAEEADDVNNPGYDIVVDDEEVLNEYYNGPSAASNGYYRQNKPVAVQDKSTPVEPEKKVDTQNEPATLATNVSTNDTQKSVSEQKAP